MHWRDNGGWTGVFAEGHARESSKREEKELAALGLLRERLMEEAELAGFPESVLRSGEVLRSEQDWARWASSPEVDRPTLDRAIRWFNNKNPSANVAGVEEWVNGELHRNLPTDYLNWSPS